jgi:methyl-accepting chemotaxis protein
MMDRSVPVFGRLRDVVTASFRRKLATALLIVFLVVSLVTVGLYVQIGALLDENVEQSMTAAANAEANELNEWSGQHRLLARVLSEHPVYDSGNVSEMRTFLEAQHSGRQETSVVRAYVVDRRNQTVTASSDSRIEGQQVSDLPWEEPFSFRDFDDVQLTQPYEVENGTTVVGFIAPIRRLPGSLLVVEINTESVFERFEHPVDGGFTRVVNSNGTVVFADDRDAALTQYSEGTQRAPIVSRGLRGESGFTDSPTYIGGASSSEYIAAYDSVSGTDWVVVEHAPAEEAYVITRRGRTWIGGIAVVALVALFVVVGVLGADVTTALSGLTDRARRIEAGEYDVPFETDRPDEFGDLNRTLESTRDTLQARIEELRETKADLETSNTALEERSAMVSVLNRILRHNVRNDVNVITGRTELAASRTDDEVIHEDLEAVKEAAWELAELSDRTQRIKQLLSETESETRPMQLGESLSSAVSNLDKAGSDATITVDGGEATVVESSPMFPVAIADVVEQILSHNDESVRVDITVAEDEADDSVVVVHIDDDCGGLPELDVHAVGAGEETPLNHGEGLALWCLEWTVSKAGGELDVDPVDSTLEIRLPRSDSLQTGGPSSQRGNQGLQ